MATLNKDIVNVPRTTYFELDSNPTWNGEGSQIAIFIGNTGTAVTGDLEVQKFKTYSAANKSVEKGGIGLDPTNNPLLSALEGFFEESAKTKTDDIGVSYCYVINLGTADIKTEAGRKVWVEAFDLAKSKRDVEVEAYVGFNKDDENNDIVSILTSANACIVEDSQDGSPRIGYSTVFDADDAKLISLTDDTNGLSTDKGATYITKTRIALTEPAPFGKIVAKICTTPYYEEPGYTRFRTIENNIYNKRTPEEMKALQDAGIIFVRDELTRKEIYTRINLAVSTAFANTPSNRPNDCLLHARRNVDHFIRELFDIVFKQLKKNETEVNLNHLQTDVDTLVDDEIEAGNMMKGTQCFVEESDKNPYDLIINCNAVPVNSTLNIGFGMYVSEPSIKVLENGNGGA